MKSQISGQMSFDELLPAAPLKPVGVCSRVGRHQGEERPDVFDYSGSCSGCHELDAVEEAERALADPVCTCGHRADDHDLGGPCLKKVASVYCPCSRLALVGVEVGY